jgi:hypothetical protein
MRKVIIHETNNETISLERADKKRLVAIILGAVGAVVCDKDGHWRIVYTDGNSTPDFATLKNLINALPKPFNIYEI